MNKKFSFSTMALLAVFFLPLLLAGFLYMTRAQWDFSGKQHGQILDPILAMQTLGLTTPDGEPFTFEREPAQWRMLLVTPNCLQQACDLPLKKIESIHEATGKDFKRVSAMLITQTREVTKEQIENFDYLTWLLLPNTSPLENGLFIADPNGNIILYYPTHVDALDILEDLRHLLRISQIG